MLSTTEYHCYHRRGQLKKARATMKQLRRDIAEDKYSEHFQAEALIDLAMALIVYGLNCAALEHLHKAKVGLKSKGCSRTNCFLGLCYGLVYYHFNQNDGERGLSTYYAQLCTERLKPLLKFSQYRNICGVYLWKLNIRLTGTVGTLSANLIGTGYGKYQIGKECVKCGYPGKGLFLLRKALDVCKFADVYYWIGEGMVKLANRRWGHDLVWDEIRSRCPVHVKHSLQEQDSGVSPPPPTAIACYRKERERKMAITSPTGIQKVMEKIDNDTRFLNDTVYVEARDYYRKAIATSPVLEEKYGISLAKLLIYLNDMIAAEEILSRIVEEKTSPFVQFDASLLLATCYANGKVHVAAQHVSRCLDLLPKVTVCTDTMLLLTQWCEFYAYQNSYRRNSHDFKFWLEALSQLGYSKLEPLMERLRQLQDEKLLRMVGQKWAGRNKGSITGKQAINFGDRN